MLAPIFLLLTIAVSTAEDGIATPSASQPIRTFLGSSPVSSSSTAGQSKVSPSDPSSFSTSSTVGQSAATAIHIPIATSSTSSSSTGNQYDGPSLIELIGNLFTPRSRRRPSPRTRSGAAPRGGRRGGGGRRQATQTQRRQATQTQ